MYVVKDDFPIEYDGILGVDFLKKQGASCNYSKKQLRIGRNTLKLYPYQRTTLQPRSETIIQVATNKNMIDIIQAEEAAPGVFIGSLVDPQNYLCPASVINTTDNIIEMLMPQVTIEEIAQENTVEINATQAKKGEDDIPRTEKVTRALRIDHLNKEELKAIKEICENYSDIFHIEGELLTCTNTIAHKIATQADSLPVNVRPYRLPKKHKEEVNRQVREMLKNGIIRSSTSQWNAPLLVVPKKADASGKPQYKSDVQTENNSRAYLRHRKRIKCNSRDRNRYRDN
ncbi:Retrovirus-related Pol polyprotein from transposon 412 [Formica fusca]